VREAANMSADAREARRAIDGRPRSGADAPLRETMNMSGGPTPGAWWPRREAANISGAVARRPRGGPTRD
jgi:hypothetical protein